MIVAATVLIGFIKRVATTYTITDRRLNIKRGIVSREVQETRLERVQNVNYKQSVYQRLMQIGDVDFDTAAGDDYNFVFYGVADPQTSSTASIRQLAPTQPAHTGWASPSHPPLVDVGGGGGRGEASCTFSRELVRR